MDKFNNYFLPREQFSELTSRYKFNCAVQKEGESLDSFITRLRNIAKDCGYADQKDKCIRDRIVFGIKDDRLREKLFRDENLTLQKAIQLCQAHEATMQSMQTFKEETIHQVKQKSKSKPAKKKEEERRNRKEIGNRKLQSRKYCGQNTSGVERIVPLTENSVKSVMAIITLLQYVSKQNNEFMR